MTKCPGDKISVAFEIALTLLHRSDPCGYIAPKAWLFGNDQDHFFVSLLSSLK
jgi:hypothetical protein